MNTCKLERLEDDTMIEEFEVKVSIKMEDSFVYLGHVISKVGNKMINIIHKKNKSIGTQKQILKLVELLSIYKFESAVIYVESFLRSSIFYSLEAMINIKEVKFRALEHIEEFMIQKIVQTKS